MPNDKKNTTRNITVSFLCGTSFAMIVYFVGENPSKDLMLPGHSASLLFGNIVEATFYDATPEYALDVCQRVKRIRDTGCLIENTKRSCSEEPRPHYAENTKCVLNEKK